jgi:hypothetical protein
MKGGSNLGGNAGSILSENQHQRVFEQVRVERGFELNSLAAEDPLPQSACSQNWFGSAPARQALASCLPKPQRFVDHIGLVRPTKAWVDGKLVDNRRVDLPADAIALQLTLHIVAEDVLPSASPGHQSIIVSLIENDRSPVGQVLIGSPPAR